MMQLTIGFIAPESVPTPFVINLVHTLREDAYGHRVINNRVMTAMCGPIVDKGRNMLVEKFLASDPRLRWLLMVDADTCFDYDTVLRLAESADPNERPIIGGLNFRLDPIDGIPKPAIYAMLESDNNLGVPILDYPRNMVFEVGYIGMSFTLLYRGVLEKIQEKFGKNWFTYDENGAEDFAFCRRAREVGCPIYCDAGATVGHIKQHIVTEQDYLTKRRMTSVYTKRVNADSL